MVALVARTPRAPTGMLWPPVNRDGALLTLVVGTPVVPVGFIAPTGAALAQAGGADNAPTVAAWPRLVDAPAGFIAPTGAAVSAQSCGTDNAPIEAAWPRLADAPAPLTPPKEPKGAKPAASAAATAPS